MALVNPPLACGDARKDLSKALNVYDFDPEMYAENRQRLVHRFQTDQTVPSGTVLLLQGGPSPTRYDTDFEPVFRQESNFAYLSGVKEPDCYLLIEVDTGKTTLFVPKLPEEYAIWMGEIRSCDDFLKEYKVDAVMYACNLNEYLRDEVDPKIIFTTRGFNADSKRYAQEATFDGIENFRVDNGKLYQELVECRVIKTERELKLLAHINRISSEAHIWVMQNIQPGMKEFQIESMFQHWGYFRGGCRHQSYTSICGCGPHASVLHYGHAGAPNDGTIGESQLCLFDMGAEFRCYTSDITCTIPSNGKFTDDQRLIYNAVLAAQKAVMAAIKPGVSYVEMHRLSYKVICEHLMDIGILHGGTIDDMMKANMGAVFMPHGLGHFMGLDTHDVGGRPPNHPKQTLPGFASLRCCVQLRAGMVLTVEPGVYFNDYSIDAAVKDPVKAKYINLEIVERFRGTGGVRIEDDVVVTNTGMVNLTQCPRTVQEIEETMAGKAWEVKVIDDNLVF